MVRIAQECLVEKVETLILRSVRWCCFIVLLPLRIGFAQLVVHAQAGAFGLPGVEVAVWGPSGRLASAYTDAAGGARLQLDRARAVGGFVTARRLGYAPVRVEIPASDSLTLALVQVSTSLPAVS